MRYFPVPLAVPPAGSQGVGWMVSSPVQVPAKAASFSWCLVGFGICMVSSFGVGSVGQWGPRARCARGKVTDLSLARLSLALRGKGCRGALSAVELLLAGAPRAIEGGA